MRRGVDTTATPPDLSVVVPAYNEAKRIEGSLQTAVLYLQEHHPSFEIIVVDDGSTDDTVDRLRCLCASDSRIRLLRLSPNQGKGAAVKRGMLQARAERVLFMDADLATPMSELEKLMAALDRGADVAIGSRGTPESQVRRSQGIWRENMGKTFNLIVQALVLPGIWDTQCGFKLFTQKASKLIFEQMTTKRFAFDVEVVCLAQALNFRLEEVPIQWYHQPESKVSITRDSLHSLIDVATLRMRFGRFRKFKTTAVKRDCHE